MAEKYTKRGTLKTFFEKNKIPTQEQFSQLIDSSVLQNDDGIIKQENEPLLLKIGANSSQQRVISFVNSFDEAGSAGWHFDLSPKQFVGDSNVNVAGFSITDTKDASRLFVKEGVKRIGVDTILPESQLHLATTTASGSHSLSTQENNLSLTLGQKGVNNQGSILLYGSEGSKKVYQRANKGTFYIDSSDGEYRFNNDNFSEKGGVLRIFEKTTTTTDEGSIILNSEGNSYFKNSLSIGTTKSIDDTTLDVKGTIKADKLLVSYDEPPLTSKDWMRGGILMSRHSDLFYIGLKDEGFNKQASVIGWGDNESDKLHLKYIDHNTPSTHDGFDVMTLNGHGHVGFTNPDPQYPLDILLDTTAENWGKFTVSMQKFWDGNSNYATIGAGTAGVMLVHPHVPWVDGRATVRYGKLNGLSSGNSFEAGMNDKGLFKIAPNNYATKGLFVNTSGFVGINNNNPISPLDIDLDTNSTSGWRKFSVSLQDSWGDGKTAITDNGHLHATIGAGASGIMLSNPHVSWRDDRATIRYGRLGGVAGGAYFDVGLISSGKFRISPNNYSTVGIFTDIKGYTGINNNNPNHALDVNGYIEANKALLIRNTSTNGNVASFDTTSTEAPYVNWKHKGLRYFYLMAGNIGGKNRVKFKSEQGSTFGFVSGNVGIGTESPAMPLHVMTKSGSSHQYAIRIQHPNRLSDTWDLGIDNDPGDTDFLFGYKGSYVAFIEPDGEMKQRSDRRLKKNIKIMSGVLDKVLQLKPSTYQFKESTNNKTKIGMIAQEVNELFPELISKKEHYTLNYSGFGVIAIKAIQEQQKMIEELKKELKEIKKIVK